MSRIFDANTPVTLHAAMSYPSGNKEMRAMTIAAFRCAQNDDELTSREMDKALLKFLLANSTSALNHWKKKERLVETPTAYVLTSDGRDECQASLEGRVRGFSTTEAQVQAWVMRMLNGDDVAIRQREFGPTVFTQR
jgi:hypothetical protein